MPKKLIDYSKTLFYKIVCKDLNITECYVDGTTSFVNRKKCHKHRCNTVDDEHHNFKVYKFIRDNGGWNNWNMIEIEKFPCLDIEESRGREQYWYKKLNATLNTLSPTKDVENFEAYQKQYRKDNKEILAEKTKKYRTDNKQYFVEFDKKYREEHKEELKLKKKQYYEKSKLMKKN